jgi:hypothetical protein
MPSSCCGAGPWNGRAGSDRNCSGWPESRSYPVRECLLIVLNEEWEHRLYAERDLDILQARDGSAGPSDTTT